MAKNKDKKKYDDDDGRVIAKMNVEGMPWYTPGHTTSISDNERDEENDSETHNVIDDLTPKERFWLYVGATKAGCAAGLIAAGIVTIAGLVAWLVLGGVS